MQFFEAGSFYAKKDPGTTAWLIFDCRAVLIHPNSRKRFAVGFTTYEGSGLWTDRTITYASYAGWSEYRGDE